MTWESDLRSDEDWTMDRYVASIYWAELGRNRNLARKTTLKCPTSVIYQAVAQETGHEFQVLNPDTKMSKTQTRLERRKISQRNQTDEDIVFTCSKCDYDNLIEPGKYKYCRRCRRVRDQKRKGLDA